eukprot:Phypoly_transcript_06891.p1 GENE.Phypoly_transcript_06891~~Phypoly_transcript_06891.p1  ORF type:complete len:388 (+),score=15.44 Phypoly_transcript_06891:513-1676(+)
MVESPLCQYRVPVSVPTSVCLPPGTPSTTGAITTGGSTTGGHKGTGDFCAAGGYVSSTNRVWDLRSMVVVLYYGLLGKTNYTVDLTVCPSSLYTSDCGSNSVLCQVAVSPARNFTLAYRNTISAVQEDNDLQISVSYTGSGCMPYEENRLSVVSFVCDPTVLNPEMTVGEPDKCQYLAKVKIPSYMCESSGPSTTGSGTTGGSTTGSNCAPGYFVKGNSCSPCPPNFFSDGINSRVCYACAPGSTAPDPASTICKNCPIGYKTDNLGRCTPCDNGTYGTNSGSPVCYPCDPGYYANHTAAISCKACPVGTYSSVSASTCTPCPSGTFNVQSGSARCTVSPPGYESVSGAGVTKCPVNTYSGAGSRCTPCPSGTTSNEGSFACFNPNM